MRAAYRVLPLVFLATPSLWGAEAPRLELGASRSLILTALPPILEQEEIDRQLVSGLTTTFAFRLDGRGLDEPGGARIEIRYELWDEVFQVRIFESDGRARSEALDSRRALSEWWKGLELVMLAPEGAVRPDAARVRLDVIPFSRSEQDDTQRWFTDSVAKSELRQDEGITGVSESNEGSLSRVFSILIATSIQRHALTTYQWNLEISDGGAGKAPEERSP